MYFSYEIAEKIKYLAKKRGITVKELLEQCNLAKGTMDNMKTSMIKADSLAKIADVLECSIDYLMGRTDIVEIYKGKEKNEQN